MVRKFLYLVAIVTVLVIAASFAFRLFGDRLSEWALVPTTEFVEQEELAGNAYRNPAMWFSRPGKADDPMRWTPKGFVADAAAAPDYAVFFVHPTSHLDRSRWNAPLEDADSQQRARLFLRGMGSAFGAATEVWAPRYRQATFGAFLTDAPEAAQAIDAAYADVEQAFDEFLSAADPATPVVLAGHSQGALHVLRLLRERVAGTALESRVAMAYPIGWPISLAHDLPALGMPACTDASQAGCIVSWSSFAVPAEPGPMLTVYQASVGFDGQPRGEGPILCVNPLTGAQGGGAPASANLGTLVPNAELSSGELVAGLVGAECDQRGLLLIGEGPDLGPYVLPGNNYHVYDIPLFWLKLREDVARRVRAWQSAR